MVETTKQIRLKDKCIEIGSCGECLFSKEYSIDTNFCSALSDYFDRSVPYPPCPEGYDIRKDCPLEDAPDPTVTKEEQMKVLKIVNDTFVTIISEKEKGLK